MGTSSDGRRTQAFLPQGSARLHGQESVQLFAGEDPRATATAAPRGEQSALEAGLADAARRAKPAVHGGLKGGEERSIHLAREVVTPSPRENGNAIDTPFSRSPHRRQTAGMADVDVPLTVTPLPAYAEARQLERELSEHIHVTETLLAVVRRARLAFRAAEDAAPPDVSELPIDLGRGAAGAAWREAQLQGDQAQLRAACAPAREFLRSVQQVLRDSREPTLARMRALELVHAAQCSSQADVPLAARQVLDDFEAAFPAFAGHLDFDETAAALGAARLGPGRPRKEEPRTGKWAVLARWVAPLGVVKEAGLQKEYQRWRRAR